MARPIQQAVAFLEQVLCAGPLPSRHVWEQARQDGYSRRTYDRARKMLEVQAKRRGWGNMGQWQLSLPPAKRQRFAANVTQMEYTPAHTSYRYPTPIQA